MEAEGNSHAHAGTAGIEPRGPLFAEEQVDVALAPDVDVADKERRRDPAGMEPGQLFVSRHLHMDDHVSGDFPRALSEGLFKPPHDEFDGGVAIGMEGDGDALAVVLGNQLGDLLGREDMISVKIGFAGVRLPEHGGQGLDRAVRKRFHPPVVEIVGNGHVPCAEFEHFIHDVGHEMQVASGVHAFFPGQPVVGAENAVSAVAEADASILKHRESRTVIVGDRIFDFLRELLRRAGRNLLKYLEIGVLFKQSFRHPVIPEYNHSAFDGKIRGDAELGEAERVRIPHVARDV